MAVALAPDMRLGLDLIDKQHAHFFELMNRMLVVEANEEDSDLVAEVIGELADYVMEHFRSEESLMEVLGYANLESHQRQHAYFAAMVEDFHRKFLLTDDGLNEELVGFLVDWFADHIKIEDQGYVSLFKENGV